MNIDQKWMVSDEDFTRLVAILRLAVPYTGLILTARITSYNVCYTKLLRCNSSNSSAEVFFENPEIKPAFCSAFITYHISVFPNA